LIASSVSIGYLPAAIGNVSWLPLDIATRSIVDICVARGLILPPVINASHPRPVPWAHIISIFSDVLKSRGVSRQPLSVVSFRQWNDRVINEVAASKGPRRSTYNRFPSTKIQNIFERIVRGDEGIRDRERTDLEVGGGTAMLDIYQAVQMSKSLKDAPKLGKSHVEKWVDYWEREGMFVSSGLNCCAGLGHKSGNHPVCLARL
ncbi:hypothetical protein BDV93DRAFT_446190, partial [Ceratobasidium sp. AG-I]